MPTPFEELDLSSLAPTTIRVRLSAEEVVEVSSDQPSMLIVEANGWLDDWNSGNVGLERKQTDADGWDIAQRLCGQDMSRIGILGLVKLLHFFRLQTLEALRGIYSELPLGLPASSTELSPSETSSTADSSSESA